MRYKGGDQSQICIEIPASENPKYDLHKKDSNIYYDQVFYNFSCRTAKEVTIHVPMLGELQSKFNSHSAEKSRFPIISFPHDRW